MSSTSCRHRMRFAAIVAALALVGCGADAVGSCGAYTDAAGTARITSISSAPADQSNCRNDPVRVLFDFTPADPAKASLAATGASFTTGSGQNPPRAWVTAAGLDVGADLPATRHDQPVGPCPPTGWTFTSIDQAAALAACN